MQHSECHDSNPVFQGAASAELQVRLWRDHNDEVW